MYFLCLLQLADQFCNAIGVLQQCAPPASFSNIQTAINKDQPANPTEGWLLVLFSCKPADICMSLLDLKHWMDRNNRLHITLVYSSYQDGVVSVKCLHVLESIHYQRHYEILCINVFVGWITLRMRSF